LNGQLSYLEQRLDVNGGGEWFFAWADAAFSMAIPDPPGASTPVPPTPEAGRLSGQPQAGYFLEGDSLCPGEAPPAPVYSCDGFEPPMNLALLPGPFGGGEIGRTVKRNRVLPFKATLVDGDDNPVTDLIAPPVIDVSFDPTIGPTEDVTDEALTPGKRDDGNQFILAGDKWTFNLWTKNYTADGTYTVTMQSGDTDEYVIDPICKGVFVIDP